MGAPGKGMIRINVHESFKEREGKARVSLVCRDVEGRFVGGLSREVGVDRRLWWSVWL